MKGRTVLWTVTNAANIEITCTMEEQPSGDYRLLLELEGNEVLSEVHYTPAEAMSRARELRLKIKT